MIDTDIPANVAAAIERIHDEQCSAINSLNLDNETVGSRAAKAKLFSRCYAYKLNLLKVAAANVAGTKTQIKLANKFLLHSADARVSAVLRGFKAYPLTVAEVYSKAAAFDILRPVPEPVIVHWISKAPKDGYRPIVDSGPHRTAQSFMIRDFLTTLGVDNTEDFVTKGGGGEKVLINQICKDLEDGYNWWWMTDIKDCFGSIKPGHLGWLGVDRRIVRGVFFLPKCAKVIVPKHENAQQIVEYLHAKYEWLPETEGNNTSLQHYSAQIVRRGLLQGSVLSPLLARAVIRRELDACAPKGQTKRYSFSDDLHLGSPSKAICQAAKQAVTKHFSSLPAGPIEFHQAPLRGSANSVDALGYTLQPGKRYGGGVHVKPGKKRTSKFKYRLGARLNAAGPKANPFQVAEDYRQRWSGSQHAWTRVPIFSESVSRTITMTYVMDFEQGIPMGCWQLPLPHLKKI